MKKIVVFLTRAARARSRTANQKRRTNSDHSLGQMLIHMGEVRENVLEMQEPHKRILTGESSVQLVRSRILLRGFCIAKRTSKQMVTAVVRTWEENLMRSCVNP